MDNRNTLIAISLCFLFLCLVFAGVRGCTKNSDSKLPNIVKKQVNNTTAQKEKDKTGYSHSYDSGANTGYYSTSSSSDNYYEDADDTHTTPPAILSKSEKEAMERKRQDKKEKIRKAAIEWLKQKTSNTALCQQTIERYKVKSHQGFANGTVALRNKDYKTALNYFNQTVKDPEATAITKYFAINNMMIIAQRMKDIELYFIAARMNAALCAKEDLTLLGIQKNSNHLEWVNRVEKTIKARNDKTAFQECVQAKLDEYQSSIDRSEAEMKVREEIEYYTELYKEMLE